jgi:hypothetical protein
VPVAHFHRRITTRAGYLSGQHYLHLHVARSTTVITSIIRRRTTILSPPENSKSLKDF